MEIRSVVKEKVEYPKIKEIDNKCRKKYNLNKWSKLGIASMILKILTVNKVDASQDLIPTIAGGIAIYEPNPMYTVNSAIILLIMIVILPISLITLIVTKLKISKNKEDEKLKKKNKLFGYILIISMILLIVCNFVIEPILWKIMYN